MFIFATCVLLVGLYMYRGHELSVMTWRVAFKNLTKDKWKNICKWTMISSVLIYIIAIVCYIFNFE